MTDKTPAQRLAEKIKAEHEGGEAWRRADCRATLLIEIVLAEIRQRRDEIGPVVDARFWHLFDDGEEFGPPKKVPMFEWVEPGRVKITEASTVRVVDLDLYRAIQEHGPKLEEL